MGVCAEGVHAEGVCDGGGLAWDVCVGGVCAEGCTSHCIS